MSARKDREPIRPVGVALIGCGRISTAHLDAIQAQPEFGRLIAVVDADRARAEQVAARYGAPYAFSDIGAVLELEAVEAVCICTPNQWHEEQALRALTAGRHVLVEKPMAESASAAARMAEAADRTGLILAAGHTFRHGAPVRYLQDHRGEFGRLRAAQISTCVHWDGPQAPWWKDRTPEQGLILSLLAPHAVDFLTHVMGEDDPIRVSVETARHQTGWQAEDEAMILFRYPQDRMAFIHLSYNQAWVLDRKTLHFEKAMVRIENGDYLWVNDRLAVQPPGSAAGESHRMGGRDLSHYFRTQFEEFARAIRGQENRSVLHREGQRVTALVERILQAAVNASAALAALPPASPAP